MRANEFVSEVKSHDFMAGHCHVMALALKQLHPDWQIRAHVGYDDDEADDTEYRVDHVYAVAPDGTAYDCRGRFDNEQQLVGPDTTGGVDTQYVNFGPEEIKQAMLRGELKRFTKQDLTNAMQAATQAGKQDVSEAPAGYKEIEFVCVNPQFPDATDPALQKKMYRGLKQIDGVVPLWQEWGDYSEGQASLSAIYQGSKNRDKILLLAKKLGVEVDLEQAVSDDYVDRAMRGEHEGQQGLTERKQSPLEDFEGLQFRMVNDNDQLFVNAFDSSGGNELGHVTFDIGDGKELDPQNLYVKHKFRSQGIAQIMYDFVKSKGYKIQRSWDQTDAGAGFWDKHRGEERVWEQGVAEGSEQISEYRDRLLQYVKSLLPNYPEYVLKDWLIPNKGDFSNLPDTELKNGIMEKLKGAGLTPNTKWQLVPDMKFTMDMFEPMTTKRLIGRAGGNSDMGMGIPRDKERHATQAALAQQQGGVRKEPVLLIKTDKGYELLEGWHRTIQHFAKYPDGYTGPAYVAVAQGQQAVAEGQSVSLRDMVNVVDQHYPKYYAELSGSDISDKQFERAIENAYKKIMQKQGVAEGSDTEINYDGNLLVSLIQNYTPQSYAGKLIKQDLNDPDSLPFHLADVVGLIDEIFYESLENGSEGVVLPDEKQDLRFFYQAAKKSKKQGVAENFADGRNPQDKGDAKRHGINTKASVSSLRKTAKQGGRKGQLAHWMANMKAGRAKAKKK